MCVCGFEEVVDVMPGYGVVRDTFLCSLFSDIERIFTKSFMVTVDVTTLGSLTGMLGYSTENLALYSQQIF